MEINQVWQCFLEIIDLIAKLAQTGIAGFVAWLAWRTFIKEEEQDSTNTDSVLQPQGEVPDLKLFETSKQTTWLKRQNGIECHIEDRREGQKGGHKWTLSPQKVKEILISGDIYVNPGYKIKTGLISIGNHTNWLYSKKLFPGNKWGTNGVRSFHITLLMMKLSIRGQSPLSERLARSVSEVFKSQLIYF